MRCFDLVCGYDDIKAELMRIHDVLRYGEEYEKLSVKRPRGLLLYGDSGLDKTRMAECFIKEKFEKLDKEGAPDWQLKLCL